MSAFKEEADFNSYEEWLEATLLEDSEEARGWYDCPEDKRSEYLENNRDWFINGC